MKQMMRCVNKQLENVSPNTHESTGLHHEIECCEMILLAGTLAPLAPPERVVSRSGTDEYLSITLLMPQPRNQ